jgi:broad specificity phosphatase PhoE
MKVVLIRHAETDYNREGRVQGQSDAPLNDRGMAQALCLARSFTGQPVDAIFSSPLKRAWQTAEAIASELGLEVQAESALIEIDAGAMDGLTGTELRERFPDFMQAWSNGLAAGEALPGGESLEAVQQRAWAFVESLRDRNELNLALCVTHNFALMSVIAAAVQLPLANISRLRQSLAGYSVVEFRNERVQVAKHNETCHLLGSDSSPLQ